MVVLSLVYQTTPLPALDVLQYIQSWEFEGSDLVHETRLVVLA
jgi:hypothetical protein